MPPAVRDPEVLSEDSDAEPEGSNNQGTQQESCGGAAAARTRGAPTTCPDCAKNSGTAGLLAGTVRTAQSGKGTRECVRKQQLRRPQRNARNARNVSWTKLLVPCRRWGMFSRGGRGLGGLHPPPPGGGILFYISSNVVKTPPPFGKSTILGNCPQLPRWGVSPFFGALRTTTSD